MGTVINWIKNNLISIVELVDIVLQALQLIVNFAIRAFFPNNEFVRKVHDWIKFIEVPTNKLKDFLLKRAG